MTKRIAIAELEEWVDAAGYDGYEVSNRGGVRRSSYTGYRGKRHPARLLTIRIDKSGYPAVKLGGKWVVVHRIVCSTFNGPSNKPMVNHINGIKSDNRPENLEWVTARENTIHAFRTGLASHGSRSENRAFKGWIQAAKGAYGLMLCGVQDGRSFGLDPSSISACLNGKRKTHGGFSFARGAIVATHNPDGFVEVPDELVEGE